MYTFVVYKNKAGKFNWRLEYNGKKMAGGLQGPDGFESRHGAIENLKDTACVFLHCAGTMLDVHNIEQWQTGEHYLGSNQNNTPIKLVIEVMDEVAHYLGVDAERYT